MNCRNCHSSFEFSKMSTDILGSNDGISFYCSDDCYFDSYLKLEKIWQECNHDTKKAWAKFVKDVWGLTDRNMGID